MNFQKKTILITGSARRIGAMLARHFAAQGCRVVLHCNRSIGEIKALLSSLPGAGHRFIAADLTDESAVRRLFAEADKVDVLINNAAIYYRPGSPEDAAAADAYDKINYQAPKLLCDLFAAQKLSEGVVVNVADAAALDPKNSGAYVESKRHLLDLTRTLAPLWAKCNLRINAVAPGPMLPPPWKPDSPMTQSIRAIPLGRKVDPADLVAAVDLLCRADSITGVILPVDGGLHTGQL